MRQPLEDGLVTLARATATYAYPARFTLVAAMNVHGVKHLLTLSVPDFARYPDVTAVHPQDALVQSQT